MRTVLLVALVLGGCSATMVSAPGRVRAPSAYAPVNEGSGSGLMCYLANGAGFVVKARREDAYKQMSNSCGGSYRIEAEGPQAAGGAIVPLGNGSAYFAQSTYWYIQYACQ